MAAGALRRTTGRRTALRSEALEGSEAKKIEVDEAGRARKYLAQSVDFVSGVWVLPGFHAL